MKAERFDGTRERRFLAQIIYSDSLLGEIAHLYETRSNLLRTVVENTLLEWCVKYYRNHGKAPGSDVKWILSDYDGRPLQDELGMLVDSLPSVEPIVNASMVLGDICEYLDKIALDRLADCIHSKVSQDDLDGCIEAIGKFSRVSFGVTTSVNPFTDRSAIVETFNDDSCKSLLKFDELGEDARLFFGDTFSRSCFVVFNAPEKGCKSATLLEFAVMALKEGKKVAYFEAGDMSRPQVFRRLFQRVANHPRRAGTIRVPTGDLWVERDTDGNMVLFNGLEDKPYHEDLSMDIVEKALDAWREDVGDMTDRFRFSDHPQDLTVPRICAELDEWERQDGFRPDFVIIDYADILQPVIKNEFRHQVNDTFARLRALSLDRKCCLITATQAKGAAYNTDTQSRMLISEDKRKGAHPTAMIGLASTEDEREKQVYHMNFILRRDDVCIESQRLYFSQCLPLCNPMFGCYFPDNHKGELHGKMKEEQVAATEAAQVLSGYGSSEFFDDAPIQDEMFDFGDDATVRQKPVLVHVPESATPTQEPVKKIRKMPRVPPTDTT